MRAGWQSIMRGKAKGSRPYLKCFLLKYEKNIFLLTFISELKFRELENWELEVPGTWELWNLGTCLTLSPLKPVFMC